MTQASQCVRAGRRGLQPLAMDGSENVVTLEFWDVRGRLCPGQSGEAGEWTEQVKDGG